MIETGRSVSSDMAGLEKAMNIVVLILWLRLLVAADILFIIIRNYTDKYKETMEPLVSYSLQ